MRAGLLLIAASLICATPAVAQGKTKAGVAPQSVQALEVCEAFAAGDPLALQAATDAGWDAYVTDSETPYVLSWSASKDLPGIGFADMYVLVEAYPDITFGYCRIDVPTPSGGNGQAAIQAIQNLDRYEGDGIQNGDGSFASLTRVDGDTKSLLLTHWSEDSFVIQLTLITLEPDEMDQ